MCNDQHEFVDGPPTFMLVNPEGEYVQGYGSGPVYKQTGHEKVCVKCGYIAGHSTKVVSVD